MYQVPIDGLRTTYAESPNVRFRSSEGRPDIEMFFAASPMVAGKFSRAEVLFKDVLDFRFYDFEIGLPIPNEDDFEFGLIECIDSQTLRQFDSSAALSRTARPILSGRDLHHYRIAFDDHGTYDIVCLGFELQRVDVEDSSPDSSYGG